ncbi:hypothetical protein L1D31_09855 [Vibrio sp. Isolate23]|nr:hypothetical protein [Vibrio sp. Isolate23]
MPLPGRYHLGNYRVYNPSVGRFHSHDSLSPFGAGGLNGYQYGNGSPFSYKDPSGHIAFIPILIGAVVGAVVGAAVATAAEVIDMAVSGDPFDWEQVLIGAALGALSGGIGAAAGAGASTATKIAVEAIDTVVSAGAEFGINVAMGNSVEKSLQMAAVGAAIGVASTSAGIGVGKIKSKNGQYEALEMMPGANPNKTKSYHGDRMTDLKKFGKGNASHLYFFKGSYKGESRITINAHGYYGTKNSVVGLTNKSYSADKINGMLAEAYDDYDSIRHIRVVACRSANEMHKGAKVGSFIQRLADLSGKTVKGYKGPVSVVRPEFGKVSRHSLFSIIKHGVNYRPVIVSPSY